MTETQFTDRLTADGLRRTADGYLVADVRCARTGIQEYAGFEVGKPEMRVVRVYRPEAEVFSADALRSYAHRPVTLEHPAAPVTAENWKDEAVGQTGDEVARDGDFVRVPMVLMDAAAIKAVEDGKRELSMGYSARLVFDSGTTPDGEEYDAVQTKLRMNHLAIVSKARGGSALKIGDKSTDGGQRMTDKVKSIMVDGLSVDVTDAAAQIIEKGMKALTDKASKAEADLADAKKDLEAKAGQIKALEKQVADAKITPEKLHEMAKARASLVADAAKVLGDEDLSGKTDAEIRRAVVAKEFGDAKDMSDDAVSGAFAVIVNTDRKPDPLKTAVKDAKAEQGRDDAYAAYVSDLRTAHMQKEAK